MKTSTKEPAERKQRLIGAAVRLMLRQGYSGASVEQICAAAEVTKGAFFHYFSSKEELCLAAMDAWSNGWTGIMDSASFEAIQDPLTRIDRLFEVMTDAYMHQPGDSGCMVGTVAQEASLSNERMRLECDGHLIAWVERASKMLSDAKASHPPRIEFDPDEVAWWLCTFVQGTMLVSKVRGNRTITLNNLRHCKAYIDGLFGRE